MAHATATKVQTVLTRERLYALVAALRSMPKTFHWAYEFVSRPHPMRCGTMGCAVGLARHMWPDVAEALPVGPQGDGIYVVPQHVDMDYTQFRKIFFEPQTYDRGWDVTPYDVADKLEEYLVSTEPVF